jgi:myo-inositol-1(or 4)-monophosphatase
VPGDQSAANAAPTEARELLELAIDLGQQAAELLVRGLDRVRASIETKSSGTDMVTEMDRASETLIVAGILARRPDDGIVGEEGTDRGGRSGVRWVIDPLDGTTNYIYGHPGFAVSIGVELVEPGTGATRSIAGVVVDPLHGDLFSAVAGEGAQRNGRVIRSSPETVLQQALIGTGFSYDPERRAKQAAVLTTVLPRVRDIRRMGAAAVDLCSVACGRLDAFYEKGLAPWDYTAGALIAAEAGAIVRDLDGQPTSPAFTLAAPPALYDPLRDVLLAANAGEA